MTNIIDKYYKGTLFLDITEISEKQKKFYIKNTIHSA